MTIQNTGNVHSFVAGANLSAQQFHGVRVNSSGLLVAAAAGEFAIGILQNKPLQGEVATVTCVGPISKAYAGGSITAGSAVATNASGHIVAATLGRTNTSDGGAAADPLIGSNVLGVALEGASNGDIISVLLTVSGASPTTAA